MYIMGIKILKIKVVITFYNINNKKIKKCFNLINIIFKLYELI